MEGCEVLHGGGSWPSSEQRSSVLGLRCEWDEGRNQLLGLVFALGELVAISTGVPGQALRMCWEAHGRGLVPKYSELYQKGFRWRFPTRLERSTISLVPSVVPTTWCVGELWSVLLDHGTILFISPRRPSLPTTLQTPTQEGCHVVCSPQSMGWICSCFGLQHL